MRRSVSRHFLLYSLAIILVAIVAVGAVTLLLVNANFSKQEEQYLRDRGDQLVEPLQSAFQFGSDPAELQGIATLGLVTGHVRIRVIDRGGRVLADSGSYGELFEFSAFDSDLSTSPLTAFQLLLDDSGHYQGYRIPADLPEGFEALMMPNRPRAFFESQHFTSEPAPQPPIATISDAAVTLPLHIDSQVVGHAEFSEGPAFGKVIRETLQQALLFGGLVALIVAAIAAMVAARQVTRPLQSLGVAADEMAQGNLQARAGGSQLAEIDHLAAQFNSMADQLAATIASLESERASLRRFIADASHELRTPLTALKTFNSLLAQDTAHSLVEGSGRTAELVEESGRQLDHLDRLTSDLLDLSRLEARLNGLDLTTSDIRPVISEAVALLQPLSDSKDQTLALVLPDTPVMVEQDPDMLRRAIENLVANAVKFTPDGRLVQVSLVEAETTASVHVQDDGPGISPAEQPYLFDRFYRGRNAAGDGSGLGLAIAREIAAIHHGAITFSSTEDEGSHFMLKLPLSPS